MHALADIAIFTKLGDEFLARWIHFLAGITWIGLLYYFNFVQGPYFNEADAGARSDATQKLVPRALWWFRWGAMLTFLSGVALLGFMLDRLADNDFGDFLRSGEVNAILVGALFGVTMFLNVWLIIWPNQKIVIANAKATAGGQAADPNAPAAARKAFCASRANTFFSIPMLFWMGFAPHMAGGAAFQIDTSNRGAFWIIVAVIWALLEANAISAPAVGAPTMKPLEKHRDTIISGFVLAAVLYVIAELVLKA